MRPRPHENWPRPHGCNGLGLVQFGLKSSFVCYFSFCLRRYLSTTEYQERRSHRIIGGDIKVDWGSGGRSLPEAEAFFVKLYT